MSGPPQNVGRTLTGGIQDVAALLPLLGTDQCEQHVGSALDGGYLYAAAAPLSIFGSLGIVKVGISVLISSISITIPKISISLRPFSMNFSQNRWLGGRTLNNAGFKPAGTVAALIAMDGTRYKAETRLMHILEGKHIDNPENLSIEWKSRDWNVSLALFTIVAAVISGTPYIALILQNSKPSLVHTPWIFPLLRTVSSCLATVCCQFLIQSRVISLMKNRIVFMVMNRVLIDDLNLKSRHVKPELDLWLKQHLRWDVDLPAEQCLWSLKQFLSPSFIQQSNGTNKLEDHVAIAMSTLSFSNPEAMINRLQELHDEHFSTPAFDRAFILTSWIILCLSLPATVAGYIGCFTLVSNSQENGPLIWLGLEAALSIVRILVWAWNPTWDEKTDITVSLKLSKDQPLVTTEKSVEVIQSTGDNTLALMPERQFLEWITPYTGPLDQFRSSESLFLYFTLTASRLEQKCLLYMTVLDFNKRTAVTLLQEKDVVNYIDATVTFNHIASEMEAIPQSAIDEKHPWRTNNAILFDELADYYESIKYALNHTNPDLVATLPWRWNLLPKPTASDNQSRNQASDLPSLTEHGQLYLGRGYEHHLKTKLVKNWSNWIAKDISNIQSEALKDCRYALADAVSDKAQWELTELDSQLAWEWTRRELSLISLSTKLEGVVERRMEECINRVASKQGNERLREWMWSEFVIGQRKRLEKEREQTKVRMEKEMKGASERAEREGRLWRDQGQFAPQWEAGLKLIDKQWSAGIKMGHSALKNAVFELDKLVAQNSPYHRSDEQITRLRFVKLVSQRFGHWRHQREDELLEMDATVKRISDADGSHPGDALEDAYQYPQPDYLATARFVELRGKESLSKVCSATVYDLDHCEKDVVYDVTKKCTTRSVINVDQYLVDSIPGNNHLLYIGTSSGKEPAFIQRNRNQWWAEQTSNSSTFYFSPQIIDPPYVASEQGTIAHIFIFLTTPSCLRLHLLHCQTHVGRDTSTSILENGKDLRRISTNNIPEELGWQEFELDQLDSGRHELGLVVNGDPISRGDGFYR